MPFETDVLESHNKYRKLHNVPPLTLNSGISKKSLAYANVLCKKGIMEHSTDHTMGENLYYYMSTAKDAKITGEQAVKSWYDEIQFYTTFFGREPDNNKAGHFTQVVWKDTQEMGVGMASKGGKFFVVANYKPPGNYRGKYAVNVLAPKHDVSVYEDASDTTHVDKSGRKCPKIREKCAIQKQKIRNNFRRLIRICTCSGK